MPASGEASLNVAKLTTLEISLNMSQIPQALPSQGMISPRFVFASTANVTAKKAKEKTKEKRNGKRVFIFFP